jgi:hypothetical protein
VAGSVEEVDEGGLLEVVVLVGGAEVTGAVAFGFVVPTEESHPSATTPATGIRAAAASRLTMSMKPSRSRRRIY